MAAVFTLRPGQSLLRLAGGVLLVLALGVGGFYMLMRPSMPELGAMTGFLSATSFVSLLAGIAAFRLGWFDRAPSIRLAIMGGYLLASLLTFINVWVTARLMFASQHDLLLATLLLLFASGIALLMGGFFSIALTQRIRQLGLAAQRLTSDNLSARVEASGADEIAQLGHAFNQMAAQLEASHARQKALEESRRELIAWASHDLQTPLASISLVVEALADGVVSDRETSQRYLHNAQKELRSLSSLIDDLFQLSKLDAGGLELRREQSSLSDAVSDTLESFSELARLRGVSLEGGVETGVDPVYMDALWIGRVTGNLVNNAIRHTSAGGKVSLSVRRKDRSVLVEVVDTGEGIQPDDLPHVFERFYRGEKSRSRATGGAGLGLAIAKGVVEAHGGTIGVESTPGVSTRFWFTFPG